MSDKTTNKERKITVRLTPHQSLMLDNMCEQLEVTKSTMIRFILDNFINEYDRLEQ